MSLHVKNIFIVVAALVCIVLVPYIALNGMLDDSRARMEHTALRFGVTLADNTLADEVRVLDAFVRDWAFWDDSYQFAEDANQEYIESNLVKETFSNQHIDIMAYYASSGELIYGKLYDVEGDCLVDLPQSFLEYWRLHSMPQAVDEKIGGIILLSEGPMMVVAQPILTSASEGPARGTMIVGRFMDAGFVERISEKLGMAFDIQRVVGGDLSGAFMQAAENLALPEAQNFFVQDMDESQSAGYALLDDIDGRPALIMQVRLPKAYFAFESDLSQFVVVFVITGLVFGAGLIFMMEKFVLSRVGRLSRAASEIARSRDMAARISLKGNDELTDLADEINVMLAALEKSEQLQAAKDQAERNAIQFAEEKRFSENLIETMRSFIIALDLEGHITLLNGYAAQTLGYRREELLGKALFETLVPGPMRSYATARYHKLCQAERYASIEGPIVGKTGQEILVQWEISMLFDENGKRTGSLAIGIDVTERHKAEALVRESQRQSEELSHKLAQKVEELERFNKMAVGREQKIIELKKEINQMCVLHNEPKAYEVGFAE